MTPRDRKAERYSRRCQRKRETRVERLLTFAVVLFLLVLAVKVGTML